MRIKLFVASAVVSVIALASVAGAAVDDTVGVDVYVKKPGDAGKVTMRVRNFETRPNIVAQRINQVIIKSKTAKWDKRGADICSAVLTNNGDPLGCPKKSKVGSGKFKADLGVPGTPKDGACLDEGDGTIEVFNFKPGPGEKVAMLVEARTIRPLQNVFVQLHVGVAANGTIVATVPDRDQLPDGLKAILKPGCHVSLTSFDITIQSPKGKKKPFFTLKKGVLNMDFQLVRAEV